MTVQVRQGHEGTHFASSSSPLSEKTRGVFTQKSEM